MFGCRAVLGSSNSCRDLTLAMREYLKDTASAASAYPAVWGAFSLVATADYNSIDSQSNVCSWH